LVAEFAEIVLSLYYHDRWVLVRAVCIVSIRLR